MSAWPAWFERLRTRATSAEVPDSERPRPPSGTPKIGAVLVLLHEKESSDSRSAQQQPCVLVLERASTLRFHPGQIAFPGGGTDPEDADAAATALREAREEVGLEPESVEVVRTLPPQWIAVSNYLVTPVLAWWARPHPVGPVDPGEVARVDRLAMPELADPANRLRVRHPDGWIGPAFRIRDLLVWGFTAGVLASLLEMGDWAQPWAQGRPETLHDPRVSPVL